MQLSDSSQHNFQGGDQFVQTDSLFQADKQQAQTNSYLQIDNPQAITNSYSQRTNQRDHTNQQQQQQQQQKIFPSKWVMGYQYQQEDNDDYSQVKTNSQTSQQSQSIICSAYTNSFIQQSLIIKYQYCLPSNQQEQTNSLIKQSSLIDSYFPSVQNKTNLLVQSYFKQLADYKSPTLNKIEKPQQEKNSQQGGIQQVKNQQLGNCNRQGQLIVKKTKDQKKLKQSASSYIQSIDGTDQQLNQAVINHLLIKNLQQQPSFALGQSNITNPINFEDSRQKRQRVRKNIKRLNQQSQKILIIIAKLEDQIKNQLENGIVLTYNQENAIKQKLEKCLKKLDKIEEQNREAQRQLQQIRSQQFSSQSDDTSTIEGDQLSIISGNTNLSTELKQKQRSFKKVLSDENQDFLQVIKQKQSSFNDYIFEAISITSNQQLQNSILNNQQKQSLNASQFKLNNDQTDIIRYINDYLNQTLDSIKLSQFQNYPINNNQLTHTQLTIQDYLDLINDEENDFPVNQIQFNQTTQPIDLQSIRQMIQNKNFGSTTIQICSNLNNLGSFILSQKYLNHCEDARKCFQKCLELQMEIYDQKSAEISYTLNNIGLSCSLAGKYHQALFFYKKSQYLIQQSSLPFSLQIAKIKYNSGVVLEKMGRYNQALEQFEISKQIKLRINGQNSIDVARTFEKIGNVYHSKGDYEKALENYNKNLLINTKILGPDSIDVARTFEKIYFLSKLRIQPSVILTDQDSTLKIQSYFLNSMQIQDMIEKNKTYKLKLVIVKCYHTLFIDHNLTMPGISLCIFSDNLKVIGDRTIDLKGSDGEPYVNPAPSKLGYNLNGNGLDGENGEPGKPGKPGGSFYCKLMSKYRIFGSGTLKIDVRGGNGGDGQNGGDGGEGKKGQDSVQIKSIQKRDLKFLVTQVPYKWEAKDMLEKINQVLKKVGTFNAQMLETYRSVGKQGCKGGNGGQGGSGGLPGNSGTVNSEVLIVEVIEGKGQEGKAGYAGALGQGGENGYKYEGDYINQRLFTVFRKQRKNIVEQKEQLYPLLQKTLVQDNEQKKNEALKITAKIGLPQVAQEAVQPTPVQATQSVQTFSPIFFGSTMTDLSLGCSFVNILKRAGRSFTDVFKVGTNRLFPSGQQTEDHVLGALSLVIASFGLSFGIQVGVSIASSVISSSWKNEPSLQPNGRGQNGQSPETYNSQGRENAQSVYTIQDQKIQLLWSEFTQTKFKYQPAF